MNPLPKHVRQRWRYLAVTIETWPAADVDRRAFQRQLWFAATNLLGDVGSATVDLSVVRFEVENGAGQAIVRTRRGAVGEARAALACVDAIDEQPVGLRVRGVSGTVRGCAAHFGEELKTTSQRDVTFEGADQSAWSRDGRIDIAVDDGFLGATNRDL